MRRWMLLFPVVLAIAGIALAVGPATKTYSSGTTDLLVALCDTTWTTETVAVNDSVSFTGSIMRVYGSLPVMTEIKFPDADVTYSFWDFTNPSSTDSVGTWTRLTGRWDNSDTVGTLYSGDILRADERARFVFINRTTATGGIVNRYY